MPYKYLFLALNSYHIWFRHWHHIDESTFYIDIHNKDNEPNIISRTSNVYLDGLVQERCNSTATHWSYVLIALTHRNI